MYRLYIHMGTPKTGTTAIQLFLHSNQEILQKQGYQFPDLASVFTGIDGLCRMNPEESLFCNGNVILDAYATTAWEQGQEAFETYVSHIFEDFRDMYRRVTPGNTQNMGDLIAYLKEMLEKSNVVISSENLWAIDYDWLQMFCQEIGRDNISLILYLRRQDYYAESLWNEVVKLGSTSDSVEEFCESLLTDPQDSHGMKYLERLNQLSTIVDRGNIILKTYEKERFAPGKSSLIQDFLTDIGVTYDGYDWIVPKKISNAHLNGTSVEYKRIYNEVLKREAERIHKYPTECSLTLSFEEFFNNPDNKNGHTTEYYFTPEYRKNMLQTVQKENATIAEKYLGEANLFLDQEWNKESTLRKIDPVEQERLRQILKTVTLSEEINS